MFESLKEEEYKKIDSVAGRKKREVDYIMGVAQEYYSRIIGFVGSQDSDTKLERAVFDETLKTINDVEEHCRPFGIRCYQNVDETKNPGIVLEWLHLNNNKGVYTMNITEKGFQVIDRLRKIRGLLPLKEAVIKARKRMFG